MEKYNGWTNYETWRVNLEIFDDYLVYDSNLMNDAYELSQYIKEYAEEIIEQSSEPGLARDYAMAFLSDVNWYEIAEHMITEYAQ